MKIASHYRLVCKGALPPPLLKRHNSSNKKFIDQLTRTEKMGAQNNHTTKQQNSAVQIHLTSAILISNESFENVSKMIGI